MITTGKGVAGFTLDPTLGERQGQAGECAYTGGCGTGGAVAGQPWGCQPAVCRCGYALLVFGSLLAALRHTPAAGEFVITHPNVQVPPKGNIYSINEGNAVNWDAATKK